MIWSSMAAQRCTKKQLLVNRWSGCLVVNQWGGGFINHGLSSYSSAIPASYVAMNKPVSKTSSRLFGLIELSESLLTFSISSSIKIASERQSKLQKAFSPLQNTIQIFTTKFIKSLELLELRWILNRPVHVNIFSVQLLLARGTEAQKIAWRKWSEDLWAVRHLRQHGFLISILTKIGQLIVVTF